MDIDVSVVYKLRFGNDSTIYMFAIYQRAMHKRLHTLQWFRVVILNVLIRSAHVFGTPVVDHQSLQASPSNPSQSLAPPPSPNTPTVELPVIDITSQKQLGFHGPPNATLPELSMAAGGAPNGIHRPLVAIANGFRNSIPQEQSLLVIGPANDILQEQQPIVSGPANGILQEQPMVAQGLPNNILQEQSLVVSGHTHHIHHEQNPVTVVPANDIPQEQQPIVSGPTNGILQERPIVAQGLPNSILQEQSLVVSGHTHHTHHEQNPVTVVPANDIPQEQQPVVSGPANRVPQEQPLVVNSVTQTSESDAEILSQFLSKFQRSGMLVNENNMESIVGTVTRDTPMLHLEPASKQVDATRRHGLFHIGHPPEASGNSSNTTDKVHTSAQPALSEIFQLALNNTVSHIHVHHTPHSSLPSPGYEPTNTPLQVMHGMTTVQTVYRDALPTPTSTYDSLPKTTTLITTSSSEAVNSHADPKAVNGVSEVRTNVEMSQQLNRIPQQNAVQAEHFMNPVDVTSAFQQIPSSPGSTAGVTAIPTFSPKFTIIDPSLQGISRGETSHLHSQIHHEPASNTNSFVTTGPATTLQHLYVTSPEMVREYVRSIANLNPETSTNQNRVIGLSKNMIIQLHPSGQKGQQFGMSGRDNTIGRPAVNSIHLPRIPTYLSNAILPKTQMRNAKVGIPRKVSITNQHRQISPRQLFPLSSIPGLFNRYLQQLSKRKLSQNSLSKLSSNPGQAPGLLRNMQILSHPNGRQILRGLYNYPNTIGQKLLTIPKAEGGYIPRLHHVTIPKGNPQMNTMTRNLPGPSLRRESSFGHPIGQPNRMADVLRKLLLLHKSKPNRNGPRHGIPSVVKTGHILPTLENRNMLRNLDSEWQGFPDSATSPYAARDLEEIATLLSRLWQPVQQAALPASRQMFSTDISRTTGKRHSDMPNTKQFVENERHMKQHINHKEIIPRPDIMFRVGEAFDDFRHSQIAESAKTVHDREKQVSYGQIQQIPGISAQSPGNINGGSIPRGCTCAQKNVVATGGIGQQIRESLPVAQHRHHGTSTNSILTVSNSVDISPSIPSPTLDLPAIIVREPVTSKLSPVQEAASVQMIPDAQSSLFEVPTVHLTKVGIPNHLVPVAKAALKGMLHSHTSNFLPLTVQKTGIPTGVDSNFNPIQTDGLQIKHGSSLAITQPIRDGLSQHVSINMPKSDMPSRATVEAFQRIAGVPSASSAAGNSQPVRMHIHTDSRPTANERKVIDSRSMNNPRQLRLMPSSHGMTMPSSNGMTYYQTNQGQLIRVTPFRQSKLKTLTRNRNKRPITIRTEPKTHRHERVNNVTYPQLPAESLKRKQTDEQSHRVGRNRGPARQPHRNQAMNPYAVQQRSKQPKQRQLSYPLFPRQTAGFQLYPSRYRYGSYAQRGPHQQRSYKHEGPYTQQGSYPLQGSTSQKLFVLRVPDQRGSTFMGQSGQRSGQRSGFRPGFSSIAAPHDQILPRQLPRDGQSKHAAMTFFPHFIATKQRPLFQVTGVNPMFPK